MGRRGVVREVLLAPCRRHGQLPMGHGRKMVVHLELVRERSCLDVRSRVASNEMSAMRDSSQEEGKIWSCWRI